MKQINLSDLKVMDEGNRRTVLAEIENCQPGIRFSNEDLISIFFETINLRQNND